MCILATGLVGAEHPPIALRMTQMWHSRDLKVTTV